MGLLCLIGEHRHLKAEAAGLEARRLATTGSHVTAWPEAGKPRGQASFILGGCVLRIPASIAPWFKTGLACVRVLSLRPGSVTKGSGP